MAIILLGLFIEDVHMFCLRNPSFNLTKIIDEIVQIKFKEAKELAPYIKGRALWCAATCADTLTMPNEQT